MRRLTTSVVVCCFDSDRWEVLGRCLASVLALRPAPDDVLIVVDHNLDLLDRCLRQWPDARVMASTGAPGLSGARNTAVGACSTDIIAFLDDDAFAAADWLGILVDCYRDGRVVAAGGAVVPAWCGNRPAWFPPEYDWVVGCSHAGMPATRSPVRNLVGANMSFRQQPLRLSGGFRPELGRLGSRPLGCEETEACIRVRRERPGGVVLYEPAAVVHHMVPGSRSSLSYFAGRCVAEGESKAVVSSFVGADEGLSSERSYIWRTLAPAVLRDLRAFARGEVGGLSRAAMIGAGLLLTSGSYIRSRLRAGARRNRQFSA